MDAASRRYRDNPSFSSSLLDQIYRSIDERDAQQLSETIRRKQSNFDGSKSTNGCFQNDHHDERRACFIQKLSQNKVCEKPLAGRRSAADLERSSMRSDRDLIYFNSSSSSCDSSCGGGFSSSEGESTMYGVLFNPKPIRTSVCQKNEFIKREKQRCMYGRDYQHEEDSLPKNKHEGKFVKTKLKALKIYSDLKKAKQPISPGGRLTTFLNSLFITGTTKKPKTSSASGGYTEAARSNSDRKSKSASASTCSSASSFSRSCLSNTPSSRGRLSNGIKRSVRFYPVSVIVDEDCQPCGHKSLYEEQTDLESVNFAKNPINEKLKVDLNEKNRHIQEAARNLLKNYQKKFEREFDSNIDMKDGEVDEDEDQFDDGMSDSSSDLFELDNLSAIGMHKYREELPVYETTYLHTNRAIANGFLM